jgi:hypothetical protein
MIKVLAASDTRTDKHRSEYGPRCGGRQAHSASPMWPQIPGRDLYFAAVLPKDERLCAAVRSRNPSFWRTPTPDQLLAGRWRND